MATNNALNNTSTADFSVLRADAGAVTTLSCQNTHSGNSALVTSIATGTGSGFFSSGVSDTTKYWNFGIVPSGASNPGGFNISYNTVGQSDPSAGTVMMTIEATGGTAGRMTLPTGDFLVNRSQTNGGPQVSCLNSSTTVGATARDTIQVMADGALSDAYTFVSAGNSSATSWEYGCVGATKNFEIQSAVSNTHPYMDGTTIWRSTQAGQITRPLQPSFYAILTTTQTNVTGDGTVYTVICDSEQFDQGNNYNNATGVFTAPVTGRYRATAIGNFGNLAATTTDATVQVAVTGTSASTYNLFSLAAGAVRDSNNQVLATGSALFTMTASDTAVMQIVASNGGSKTISAVGQISGTQPRTSFMMELVN